MAEPIKLKVQVLKLVLPDPTVPTVVTQSLGVKEFTFVKELGEGGMRRAYIYKDADKEIIVKEFKDSKRNTYDQQLKESAGSMFADWYAREFNLRLEKTKYEKRKRVRFVKPMLGRILNGRYKGEFVTIEDLLEGQWKKWNDNTDGVSRENNTPQAFSHFTWQLSDSQQLVMDLQGFSFL